MAGLSEIQATTYEHREKKPADAIADNIAFLAYLRSKGRVKTVRGGRVIWENIKYAQNAYVQRIDANERIAIGYNQTLTGFEYSPKIIVVPTVINALEEAQNQGEAEFLDLLDEREDAAESSLTNAVETDLQGDGTGFGGKSLAGIKTYIPTTNNSGTVGGLDRAVYTAIQNVSIDAPSTFTGATDSSNIESRVRYVKNKLVRNGAPDLFLAGETYFNAGCDAASAKQRITKNEEMATLGFDNVIIAGMTMLLAAGKVFSGSTRIAADRGYLVRSETMALRMYQGFNFQPVPKRMSFDQLVEAGISVGIGNLTSNNPGLNGVMYDS